MQKLIFLCFLIVNFSGLAQFRGLPTEQVKWTVSRYGGFGELYQTYYRPDTINSDTLINGTIYTKLRDHYCNAFSPGEPYCYLGAYRSDSTGKTFFVLPNDTLAYLLFDVGVVPGDTIPAVLVHGSFGAILDTAIVDSVSTKIVGPKSFRVVSVHYPGYNDSGWYDQWIESIGSTLGFFNEIEPSMSGHPWLNCYTYNDSTYYMKWAGLTFNPLPCDDSWHGWDIDEINSTNELEIGPNPFGSYLYLNGSYAFNSVVYSFYNSLGEKVCSIRTNSSSIELNSLPPGFYLLRAEFDDTTVKFKRLVKQ